MSETADKKKTQKLQRAIVDGLEDVKAVDIQVYNTEGLSPLFERVIIASGNTNRQTKALAASVRDAVREAGFDKPRIEGEENGEWIIVDCGQAVVHIMQPTIRQYYRLEEIWGEVPVRLRSSEARVKAARAAAEKSNAASARKAAAQAESGALSPADAAKAGRKAAKAVGDEAKAPARKAPRTVKTVKTAGGSAVPPARKAPARKAAAKKVQVVKVGAPVKKPAAKRAAPKKA